jgi:hypothetical protein
MGDSYWRCGGPAGEAGTALLSATVSTAGPAAEVSERGLETRTARWRRRHGLAISIQENVGGAHRGNVDPRVA